MSAIFRNQLIHLFGIEEEYIDELYSLFKFQKIKKSDYVLKENEVCNFIGLVVEGSLRTFYINESGNEISFLFHFNQRIDNIVFTDYESFLLRTKSL